MSTFLSLLLSKVVLIQSLALNVLYGRFMPIILALSYYMSINIHCCVIFSDGRDLYFVSHEFE